VATNDLEGTDTRDERMPLLLPTACTALVLFVLLLTVAAPLLSRPTARDRAGPSGPQKVTSAGTFPGPRKTIVYLAGSSSQAEMLDEALDELTLETEASGEAPELPLRLVVVQTPEQVLRGQIIDFTILATQAPGLDLEVVDLR
jgi:hypothetical protein